MNINQTILAEAISAAQFPKVSVLIRQYLKRNLSSDVYLYPEPEHFKHNGKTGVGIRYFLRKNESVRFNWLSDSSVDTSKNLVSVTYWDGSSFSGQPSMQIEFDRSQSLVKSLPMVVNFLQAPKTGKILFMEVSNIMESVMANINADFSSINEAKVTGGDILPTIQNVIRAFSQGLQLKDIYTMSASIGTGHDKVCKTIRALYPDFFAKEGATNKFVSKDNAKKIDAGKIASALGSDGVGATVSSGGTDVVIASKEIQAMEDNLPHLVFEEQLADLRRSMALLMQGAVNGLFVAGKPGVGKTQTIEDELQKRGLTDGTGYFKITGSASTAGIYRLLYEHRNDILLFDDSDGALADQDSRNLFKSATDTKKVRKISWMKAGKNYVDPEDMPEDDEDGGGPAGDVLPRYFDYKGKIIFISNLKMDKLDPDTALRTRAIVINIWPTDTEVIDFMYKIAPHIKLDVDYVLDQKKRMEVCDVIRARPVKKDTINLRMLVRGLNIRAGIEKDGGHEWLPMVQRYA